MELSEQDVQALESVANTLRGMTMDRRIPAETVECLRKQIAEIEAITDRTLEDEDDEPDPDLLREDRDERQRLTKEDNE